MSGEFDWPDVPDIGGPYGYSVMIVEGTGIRLSCSGKLIPVQRQERIYRALVAEQKKLIRARPRTIEEAYAANSIPLTHERVLRLVAWCASGAVSAFRRAAGPIKRRMMKSNNGRRDVRD